MLLQNADAQIPENRRLSERMTRVATQEHFAHGPTWACAVAAPPGPSLRAERHSRRPRLPNRSGSSCANECRLHAGRAWGAAEAIIVVTDSYYFVGPDSGLFSLVYQEAERIRVHHITSSHYYLPNPGPTFHGRDIFAPAAAHGSRRDSFWQFRRRDNGFRKIERAPGEEGRERFREGHVDATHRPVRERVTNITYKDIQSLIPEGGRLGAVSLPLQERRSRGLKKFYAEAAPGEPGAIINSSVILKYSCSSRTRTALSIKRGDVIRFAAKPA